MNFPSSKIFRNVATAFMVVVVLFGASCSKDEKEKIGAVKDRKTIPGLVASKITTVISDSGITRYRIYTDKWDIFDKAQEPYWEFKKGIYFERFNEKLIIDASFRSDFAKYYEYKKLWEFKGKVKAVNLQGEMFETELLYWDQQQGRLYSDKFMRVTRPTMIISGIGFEADQSLSKWKILKPQGPIYVQEKDSTPPVSPPATIPPATPATSVPPKKP